MREPRPKQRFPHGGKQLYELLRLDHEPVFVRVWPAEEVSREVAGFPDTLTYEQAFDPMVYFWPVEGQHVLVDFLARPAEPDLKRLVSALQRDGAAWVTVMWKENKSLRWEQFGDAAEFMSHRYGISPLEFVAFSGGRCRASLDGDESLPAHHCGLPDRERQDLDGHGDAVSSPPTRDDGDVHGSASGAPATNRP